MPDSTITITGLQETENMLATAPKNVVANSFLRALDAAGKVIEAEVWPRTPIELKAAVNKAHGGKGALVGRLDNFIELDSQFRGGTIEIGFGPLGHIALWVEYGHRQVTGGRLTKEGKGPGRLVGTVEPHPFMRPAFDASADAAIDAFASSLDASLREGLLNG